MFKAIHAGSVDPHLTIYFASLVFLYIPVELISI